jgi:hypothetical protein
MWLPLFRYRAEVLVDLRDDHSSFSDGRGDALDGAASHVANGEDTGDAGFHRVRRTS